MHFLSTLAAGPRNVARTGAFALLLCAAADSAPASDMVELGTLGGTYSTVERLNNSNQVCGSSSTVDDDYEHAFLWTAGSMRDLGTLGGQHSHAVDMNDAGQVVGWAHAATCHPEITSVGTLCLPDVHAFFYDGETMIDLGALTGAPVSYATAVNASGQVTGYARLEGGTRAFLYSGGVMTILGTLGGSSSYGTDINAAGDVVGSSNGHPFLYSGGVMTDLGTPGGSSGATAINSAGDVIGTFTTAESEYHAFLYRAGTMTDLGKVIPYAFIDPVALNDAGQVLLSRDTGSEGPAIYENGVFTAIGTPYETVRAINASGQVVGTTYSPSTGNRAFRYSGGGLTILGSPDGPNVNGVAINDFGRVAGSNEANDLGLAVLFSHLCPPTPAENCLTAAKSSFQMKRSDDPGKSSLGWSWSSGGALTAEGLGQPSSSTAYELCIYDSVGVEDVLVGDLSVLPNPSWRGSSTSQSFRDSTAAHDGVRSMQVRSGDEGDTRAKLKAKGANLSLPAPVDADTFLHLDSRVTVQLRADTTGVCWTSEFTSAARNDGESFKASAP